MSTPKSSFKRDSFWILKDHARKERKKERNIKIQGVYVEMLQRYDFLKKVLIAL